MEFDLFIIVGAGAFSFSFILFSWFFIINKTPKTSVLCDKITSICNCKEKYCGYCGVKICKCNKSVCSCKESMLVNKPAQIKNFLYKRLRFNIIIHILYLPTSQLGLILQKFFDCVKLKIKNKKKVAQTNTKYNLHKIAKKLWNEGKYLEAKEIDLAANK